MNLPEPTLQVAQVVTHTEAEGPGVRFAIWLQGCPLRCPGCCNPEMLSFEGGQTTTVSQLLLQIDAAMRSRPIEGVTLLGGEPFSHSAGAAPLAAELAARELTLMIFSGFHIEQLRDSEEPTVQQLLVKTDLLVDGPYERDKPDSERRWVGSTNQRIHFLSDRYSAADSYWSEPNTLEIRLENSVVAVNGFPSPSSVGLWKRIKPPRRPNFESEES